MSEKPQTSMSLMRRWSWLIICGGCILVVACIALLGSIEPPQVLRRCYMG